MADLVTAVTATRVVAPITPPRMPTDAAGTGFGDILGQALSSVNALQQQGQEAARGGRGILGGQLA